MRRLFEGGTYSSNYCNWQLKSLLHLGQIVITFRTLLHLGSFITFRPSTVYGHLWILYSCVILGRGPSFHPCCICLSISQFCFLDLLLLKALPHYVETQSKQTRQKNIKKVMLMATEQLGFGQ